MCLMHILSKPQRPLDGPEVHVDDEFQLLSLTHNNWVFAKFQPHQTSDDKTVIIFCL